VYRKLKRHLKTVRDDDVDNRLPGDGQALSYCRWADLQSPYVVELETGLADRLLASIPDRQSESEEFGGLLIGEYAKAAKPTLRIDDIVWMGHRTSGNPLFELTPEERIQLSSIRRNLITPTRTVLGFFRTHARGGPLVLSASDRELLEREFRHAFHVALLIRANHAPTAVFFVQDERRRMQAGPAYMEFRFDSGELSRAAMPVQAVRSTPTLGPRPESRQPEQLPSFLSKTQEVSTSVGRSRRDGRLRFRLGFKVFHRLRRALIAAFASTWRDLLAYRSILLPLALSCFALCLLFTLWAPFTASVLFRAPQLRLSAKGNAGMIEVRWHPRLPDSERITSSSLIVDDGTLSREVRLSPAELKLGAAAYTPLGGRVRFTLVLRFPDSMTITQSTDWVGKPPAGADTATASDRA
jgi:hypothetical protein